MWVKFDGIQKGLVGVVARRGKVHGEVWANFIEIVPTTLKVEVEWLAPNNRQKEQRYPPILDKIWRDPELIEQKTFPFISWLTHRVLGGQKLPIPSPGFLSLSRLFSSRVVCLRYNGKIPYRVGDVFRGKGGEAILVLKESSLVDEGFLRLAIEAGEIPTGKKVVIEHHPQIAMWDLGISEYVLPFSEYASKRALKVLEEKNIGWLRSAWPLNRGIFEEIKNFPGIFRELVIRSEFGREGVRRFWGRGKRKKKINWRTSGWYLLAKAAFGLQCEESRKWLRTAASSVGLKEGVVERSERMNAYFLEVPEELLVGPVGKELRDCVAEILNHGLYERNIWMMFSGYGTGGFGYYGIPVHLAEYLTWLPKDFYVRGRVLIIEIGEIGEDVKISIIPFQHNWRIVDSNSFLLPEGGTAGVRRKVFLIPIFGEDVEYREGIIKLPWFSPDQLAGLSDIKDPLAQLIIDPFE